MKQRIAKKPSSGRPREFDAEKALDAAVRIFWEKGYDGTSLSDLDKAMGINRPSLYAAFGNKEELFLRALKRYGQTSGKYVEQCLSAPSAREGIERLLRDGVVVFTDPKNPGGCFSSQATFNCSSVSDGIKQSLEEMRKSTERLFRQRFARAVKEGELPPTASPPNLARYYAVVLQGLGMHAKAGGTRSELLAVVTMAMHQWPPKPSRARFS